MKRKDMLRFFYLIEHNLAEGIQVGFHSHNNLQLAYANAQTLVELGSQPAAAHRRQHPGHGPGRRQPEHRAVFGAPQRQRRGPLPGEAPAAGHRPGE